MTSANGSLHGPMDIDLWVRYLQERAAQCVRLARDCPDPATAGRLHILSIDLIEKAAELETLRQESATLRGQ